MNDYTRYMYRRYGKGGQTTQEYSQIGDRNPQSAFEDAIIQGRLTDAPGQPNWAGNYMYMGTTRAGDHFKHILTRQYLKPNAFGCLVDGMKLDGAPAPDPDETLAYSMGDDPEPNTRLNSHGHRVMRDRWNPELGVWEEDVPHD